MKNPTRLFIIILLLFSTFFVNAQDSEKLTGKEAKDLLEKAEQNFEAGNYIDALDKFQRLHDYKPSDLYYKLMMGICYTYSPEEKEKAIEIIEQVKVTNPEYNLVNFYLAKAYAVNYDFDKAVTLFNMYLSNSSAAEENERGVAQKMIQHCKNAKEILTDTITQNIVENIKYPVNSQYSEYVPVISADESVMIFTYRGVKSKGADKIEQSMGSVDYNEDVFISYKKDGEWTEPESIGNNINTEGHDAAIGLSVDGQTLFIYKSENNNLGDIYVSKLNGKDWSKPERLKGDVNKDDSWEGSASLSANGKVLYFASDREGGRGGRDLYKAELQSDGSWGNVQNLGYTINTAYNDDDPFIHPDNKTLYFSSEGHTSIGGYDIFYSKMDEYGNFGEAVNIGYPINTIDDNRYFVLAADGRTGYYSGGGEKSIGEQDIFKIITGKVGKPVLALLLGNVYFNDVATGSYMNLYRADNGEMEGSFKSNSESGKYVMALTPGRYEIEVELETGETVRDSINLEEITEYLELYKDFRIYSDSNLLVANDNPSLQQALINALNGDQPKTIDTLFTDNAGKPKDVKPLDAGRSFKLENIFYDFDKSTLRSESKKELDRLVVILKENPTIKVEISSHTDGSRNVEMAKKNFARKGIPYTKEAHDKMSQAYNQKLSQRRAQSVVNYLVEHGISKSRLVPKGYGEMNPVATNDTEEGKQQNRRTEFKVLSN